jgi:signal transduction histidine kinase
LIAISFALELSKSILRPLDVVNIQIDEIAHGKDIKLGKYKNEFKYIELKQLIKNVFIMDKKIKHREETNRQKDKQIYESAKLAQMGEMIGNIAHQWRQPLSVISTASSGMKLEKEYGILSDEKFFRYCDSITENTTYLSETIDMFRDFIKKEKEFKRVILQERIDTALNITKGSLDRYFIKVDKKIDYTTPIHISLVIGELSQMLINIINNAKDALVQNKIKDPLIIISCYNQKNKAIITIEDNAGGIPTDILPKIFDPYFTTKHQSQGTGLGLYMSYKIVNESLKGKIYATNTTVGAKFTIELPIT